jgi:hypothetical protein
MGGSKSETKLPEWYSDYAKRALALSDKIAQQGYTPYQGPDIAAFNKPQIAGMQAGNDWAAAFGGPGAQSADISKSLMPTRNFGNGMQGYSSFGGFQDAMAKMQAMFPGQYDYMKSFAIDPVTGAGATAFGSGLTAAPPPIEAGGGGGGSGGGTGGAGGTGAGAGGSWVDGQWVPTGGHFGGGANH